MVTDDTKYRVNGRVWRPGNHVMEDLLKSTVYIIKTLRKRAARPQFSSWSEVDYKTSSKMWIVKTNRLN